ncbi:hydra actinoporin-like toxin 1 [Hypanus sabinus]|uniref:hydra actinoporin-like toxin 1 n=1 Tax=Hypanus sabinus TaxID=79690 RepID=UPI0028C44D05|nr:hydra actinoporin-like toxin 1 [Hypanus sabinus]
MAEVTSNFTRSVEIQIINNSENQNLTCPAVYLSSGFIATLPTPIIHPGQKGNAVFVRTSGTARGSVGVLTYGFGQTQISMLFSNPYDYNLYPMVSALYIPPAPELTDESLFNKMYYELPQSENFAKAELRTGSAKISVTGGNLVISATIKKMEKSLIDVVIRDVY